jgi:HAE1 family hydrophobic/amphiphilic exporter-1
MRSKRSLDEILDLALTTASGEKVALRNMVTSESSRGPILIDRKDQQRRVTVTANSPGATWAPWPEVQGRLDQIPRPVGYDLMVAGNFEEQHQGVSGAGHIALLALVLVYMVLACQYESLRDPLVVMFSVPLAASRRAGDLVCDENDIERTVLHRLHHAGRDRGQQCDICWWTRPAD